MDAATIAAIAQRCAALVSTRGRLARADRVEFGRIADLLSRLRELPPLETFASNPYRGIQRAEEEIALLLSLAESFRIVTARWRNDTTPATELEEIATILEKQLDEARAARRDFANRYIGPTDQ